MTLPVLKLILTRFRIGFGTVKVRFDRFKIEIIAERDLYVSSDGVIRDFQQNKVNFLFM